MSEGETRIASRSSGSRRNRDAVAGPARRAALAAGAVGVATVWGAALAAENLRWYAGLLKPALAPAPWLAALASLGLAGLIGAAFYRVLGRPDYLPDRPAAIRLFLVTLGLDAAWSWLFFAGRHPSIALAAAAALTAAAAATAWRFATVDRRAGLLLVPWVLAAAFAFLLDLAIARLNPA